jgi:hypothetical protein
MIVQNHNFTKGRLMNMMDNSEIRGGQMIGHMMENQEIVEQFQESIGNQTGSGGMGMVQ